MTEYITKEQAIDEVWDAFMSHDDPDLGRVIEENIKRLPAADVAEVVRCKDCKDFRPWGGQSKLATAWFMFATARIRSRWRKLTFAAMATEWTVKTNANNP